MGAVLQQQTHLDVLEFSGHGYRDSNERKSKQKMRGKRKETFDTRSSVPPASA